MRLAWHRAQLGAFLGHRGRHGCPIPGCGHGIPGELARRRQTRAVPFSPRRSGHIAAPPTRQNHAPPALRSPVHRKDARLSVVIPCARSKALLVVAASLFGPRGPAARYLGSAESHEYARHSIPVQTGMRQVGQHDIDVVGSAFQDASALSCFSSATARSGSSALTAIVVSFPHSGAPSRTA